MKIKSNILYDLLDQNTGEQVTFVKTTIGYDGTVITSENEAEYVDGVIYRKLKATDGGGYAKRVAPGGYGFIEWFVGDDLSNGVANLDAVIKLSRAGLKVKLNRGVYPLECATNTTVNTDTQPLFLEGEGKGKTKIILKTKHSTSGGTWLRGYFKGDRDISLKNLSISTQSYEDGILDEINSEYKFCSIPKPDKIDIELINVNTYGSITFYFYNNVYGSTATPEEVLEYYVNSLKTRGCEFNYASSLFRFSECRCMLADFQDGHVKELLGHIISAGGDPTRSNKLCIWNNMHVVNTIIPESTTWYHTPVVFGGDTIYYTNSSVYGLLNKDKTPRNYESQVVLGAETYALYATVNNLHFRNNFVINVLGVKEQHADNCAFKIKGSRNIYCENNTIIVEKKCLVDVGVLNNIEDSYSSVDKDTFVYTFFGAGKQNVSNEGELIFKNNRVRIPYVNYACMIPWATIDISGNTIEVDYVAIDRDGDDQVLFYNHNNSESFLLIGKKSVFENNSIKVNTVEDYNLHVELLTEKTPYFITKETTSYSDIFSISDNKFYGENINYSLGINRAKRISHENNKCLSNGCFATPDKDIILPLSDEVPSSYFDYSIESIGGSTFMTIMKPKLWGTSKAIVKNNTQNERIIMKTNRQDWLNDTVNINNPVLFYVNLKCIDGLGVITDLQYLFAQTSISNIRYRDYDTGLVTNVDPRDDVEYFEIRFADKYGNISSPIGLYARFYFNRTAEFYISGLSDVASFSLETRVEGKAVNPVTFYDEWLAIDGSSLTSHEMLTGIQGGTTGEHYHLTAAEYLKLSKIAEGATKNENTDELVEGSNNKYFTEARVRATKITGYEKASAFTALEENDSILEVFGKLEKGVEKANEDISNLSTGLKTGSATIEGGVLDFSDLDIINIALSENTTINTIDNASAGGVVLSIQPDGYTLDWSSSLINPLNISGSFDKDEDMLAYILVTSVSPLRFKVTYEINHAPVIPPPVAPSELMVTAINSGRIDLSWTDNSDDESGFQIERSIDNVSFSLLEEVGAGVTSFQDESVDPETTYYYRVRAVNENGSSTYTSTESATTPEIEEVWYRINLGSASDPAMPNNFTGSRMMGSRLDDLVEDGGFVSTYAIETTATFGTILNGNPCYTTGDNSGAESDLTLVTAIGSISDSVESQLRLEGFNNGDTVEIEVISCHVSSSGNILYGLNGGAKTQYSGYQSINYISLGTATADASGYVTIDVIKPLGQSAQAITNAIRFRVL